MTFPTTGYTPPTTRKCVRCDAPMTGELYQLCDACHLQDAARAASARMDARLPEIIWHMDDFEEACDEAYTREINRP